MELNSILIFRPFVKYLSHNSSQLFISLENEIKYFSIPQISFDFAKLKKPVPIQDIPEEIQSFLMRNLICEQLNEKVFLEVEQNPLNKYFHLFYSYEQILKNIPRINSEYITILNLTRESINEDFLGSVQVKLNIISSLNEFHLKSQDLSSCKNIFVFADEESDQDLLIVNEFFLKQKLNWFLIKLNFSEIQVGPFFNIKQNQGCYHCFIKRIHSKLQPSNAIKNDKKNSNEFFIYFKLFIMTKFLLNNYSVHEKSIILFDPFQLKSENLPFINYPLCEVC